jgi:hypothetical protein
MWRNQVGEAIEFTAVARVIAIKRKVAQEFTHRSLPTGLAGRRSN